MPFPSNIPTTAYEGIPLYIWIASIVIHLMGTIIIKKKANASKELISLNKLLNSYTIFLLLLGINRVFFLAAYLSPEHSIDFYNLFLSFGYICAAFSVTPLIYTLEKYMIQKTKFIFSGISLLIVVLSIISAFLPDSLEEIRGTIQLMSLAPALIWFMLYIWIIKNSTGAPQKKAIFTVVAVFILLIGFFLDSEMILTLGTLPVIVAPLIYMIGVMLVIYIIKKE